MSEFIRDPNEAYRPCLSILFGYWSHGQIWSYTAYNLFLTMTFQLTVVPWKKFKFYSSVHSIVRNCLRCIAPLNTRVSLYTVCIFLLLKIKLKLNEAKKQAIIKICWSRVIELCYLEKSCYVQWFMQLWEFSPFADVSRCARFSSVSNKEWFIITDLKKKDWMEQPIILAPTKLKPAAPPCWDHFRSKAYCMLWVK